MNDIKIDLNTVRATHGGPLDMCVNLIKLWLDHFFLALELQPATDLDVAYVLIFTTFCVTLLVYYTICGRKHNQNRQALKLELERALHESRFLQQQLDDMDEQVRTEELEKLKTLKAKGKEIRVFVEGAFDLMHYGHANAFRQAREVGTYLVAGVNSSKTIEQCKGAPPVLTDQERCAVVSACKWVDEVIEETPYVMTPEYLDWVIDKYKIDYVIHGDDPCIGPDGKDV
jgi:ethanolamine-phosphate cytidylyltransferase